MAPGDAQCSVDDAICVMIIRDFECPESKEELPPEQDIKKLLRKQKDIGAGGKSVYRCR